MTMRAVAHIASLTVLVAALTGASRPDSPAEVLMEAGPVQVTVDEFKRYYVEYLLTTGVQDDFVLRKAFAQNLLASKLLIAEAYQNGVAEDATFQFERTRIRQKLLIEAYIQQALFDTLTVDEQEVAAMFERVNTQLQAWHLYARTREEAAALYARLQAGASFEALAREVFSDPHLAENGGSVGVFGFDEMDPAFEDAAFNLSVGEISEPVQTAQGFSIIQLEDRFTKPILTEFEYAQKKDKLERYVRRRKQQTSRQQHARTLAEQLDIELHQAGFQALLHQIRGTALLEDEADTRTPLATFGTSAQRRTWTLADLRERAQFTSEKQRAQVQSDDALTTFIQGLVVRDEMMRRAEAAGLDTTPAFQQTFQTALDEWVLDAAREDLYAEVQPSEDELRAAFEAAPATEFMAPAQVRVYEISVDAQAEAEALRTPLHETSLETLLKTGSPWPGAEGRDLGLLTPEMMGALSEAVFAAAEGDIVGPFEVQGRYVLLKVGTQRPAQPMTYEEARPLLREQLQYHQRRALVKATYQRLLTQYEPHLDQSLLHTLSLTRE